jgi:TPR repeat protein
MSGWRKRIEVATASALALLAACAQTPTPPSVIVPAYAESEDERLRQAMADLAAGNYEAAWFRFWDLALDGHPAAQINLAQMYREGLGIPVEPQVARRWVELAATADHPLAQYRLGELYETSAGGGATSVDLQAAALWYERAAAQGFTPAAPAAERVRRRLRQTSTY